MATTIDEIAPDVFRISTYVAAAHLGFAQFLVRDEQPQAITFIVSYLPPEKAAQVLNLLRDEQRDQVIERFHRPARRRTRRPRRWKWASGSWKCSTPSLASNKPAR